MNKKRISMATLTITIPEVSTLDLAEIQSKLSTYADFLTHSLKQKNAVKKKSASLSSIYGIAHIDENESLETLKKEAFTEKFNL